MNEKKYLFKELKKLNPTMFQVYATMIIYALAGFENAINYINDLKK